MSFFWMLSENWWQTCNTRSVQWKIKIDRNVLKSIFEWLISFHFMNFESYCDLLNNMFKSQSIFIVYVIEKVSITIFNSFRLFLRLLWWSYLRIHSWLIGKNPIVKPWTRRSSAFPGITTSHSFCSNSKLAWKRTARPPRGRAQPCQELTMSVSGCISSNRYVNCLYVSKQKKKKEKKGKNYKLPKTDIWSFFFSWSSKRQWWRGYGQFSVFSWQNGWSSQSSHWKHPA